MKLLAQLIFVLGLLGAPLFANGADLAVLRNGFSIRHERREVVGSVTRLYLDAGRDGYVDVPTIEIDRFEKDLAAPAAGKMPDSSQPMNEVINAVSSRHHLDPDLINSVIHAESGFNPSAVSSKGAQGLMQLMPQTASRLGVVNSFDPGDNLEGGTRYLRELLERYNFDLIKALAAYNAGPQRVEQYHGVPPYYETQAYVAGIIRDFNRKKLAERKAAAVKTASYHKGPTRRAPTVKRAALPDTAQQVSR
ncbi:MAG TPA: lytic transglycosylase domain-containing protein [Terriglobales bacterium]|nr:lytic transglycosylase domain-containing protein [Terriglobales bacterium]